MFFPPPPPSYAAFVAMEKQKRWLEFARATVSGLADHNDLDEEQMGWRSKRIAAHAASIADSLTEEWALRFTKPSDTGGSPKP